MVKLDTNGPSVTARADAAARPQAVRVFHAARRLPLSPVQEGMYFHRLRRKDTVYLEQMLCDVVGPLDPGIVERVLNQLMQLHEPFRTVFATDEIEGPYQQILPHRPGTLRYTDLSGYPDAPKRLQRRIQAQLRRSFDLTREASRCELFKLSKDLHVFLWTYHHIIMDAVSIRLLQRHFCQLYFAMAKELPLPDIAAPPYSHYIHWIGQQGQDEARGYWANYLSHCVSTQRSVAALPGRQTEIRTVPVEGHSGVRELLEQIARRHRWTINAIVLAVWGTYLLHRFGLAEAVFGCVVSGRLMRLRGVEKISGLFVNTLPVRIRDSDRVCASVAAIQRHLFASGPYAHLSLTEIMECGGTTVDDMLTVVNFSIDDLRLEGEDARRLPFAVENIRYNERAQYPFYLDVFVKQQEFRLLVHYRADAYEVDGAEIGRSIERILQLYADDKDRTLSEILSAIDGSALSDASVLHF